MPYISASIIMQLAVNVVPQLGKIQREEGGRQKITQYTRFGTLFLCLVQGYFLAVSFERPEQISILSGISDVIERVGPLVPDPGWMFRFVTVVTLTSGTMFLMWLGEQITDKGIGNGISMIITVGIVAQLPSALTAAWNIFNPPAGSDQVPLSPFLIVMLVAFLLIVIAATITLTQAMRKIPVQYAKQVRGNRVYGGQSSFLPLKVNYSGVMPIIFANALLIFPATFLDLVFRGQEWSGHVVAMFNPGTPFYIICSSLLVFFFSFFWVAIVFNPTQIADDMKRHGGFVPGVRPGEPTAKMLDFTMTRLTFAGAIFLTVLAVLPMLVQTNLGIPYITAQFFGGTSLLIIVGVMLDTMRQSETYLLQRHYDGFLKKGKVRGRSAVATSASGSSLPEEKMVWLALIIGLIAAGGIIASLF
jgi:preprotein translocase subunit SecY